MDGNFLSILISLTGLPEDQVRPWLLKELRARGKSTVAIDEDVIRELLAEMVRELHVLN